MREPIAAPNTMKYSDVESTGDTMLWKMRAPGARHLEPVDRPDRAEVHASFLTRSTKMSSSELCVGVRCP